MAVVKDRDLTPPQVARRLHIHVNTVRSWVRQGRFETARTTCTGRILIASTEVRDMAPKGAGK